MLLSLLDLHYDAPNNDRAGAPTPPDGAPIAPATLSAKGPPSHLARPDELRLQPGNRPLGPRPSSPPDGFRQALSQP